MNSIEKEMVRGMVGILNDAFDAYRAGNPIITEERFNMMLEDLKQIEEETGFALSVSPTQRVKATLLPKLQQAFHSTPMRPANNCKTVENLIGLSNNRQMVATPKLNGVSLSLTYKDGILIRAISRGNGFSGFDITQHVKQIRNVPFKIKKDGFYIVNGEAIITDDDFSNLNNEFDNSENAVSSAILGVDTSLCYDRKLKFFVWNVVEGGTDNFFDNLHDAEELGFDVVPYWAITTFNPKKIKSYIDYIFEYASEERLPCDGVIFRFNDAERGEPFYVIEK